MDVAAPHSDRQTFAYRFATAASYLVNPLILPAVQFGLVLWHFGAPGNEIGIGVGAGLMFFFLIPLAYLARMVRLGTAGSLEVRQSEARTRPFLIGIASYVAGFSVLWLTLSTARPLMLALAALYPINTVLVTLINLRWKISVHTTCIAGFFAALLLIAAIPWTPPTYGRITVESVAPWLVLIPLLMWARVRSGAHTPGQVIAGSLFGIGVTVLELVFLFRLSGLWKIG